MDERQALSQLPNAKDISKLIEQVKMGVGIAQEALQKVQPVVDQLDNLVPDAGYGAYLHMTRVAVDEAVKILSKV